MRQTRYALFTILFIAFAPGLFFVFPYHNDLGIWLDRGWASHHESGHLILFARPLGAVLLDLQTNLLRLFEVIWIINLFRFFAVGMLGVLALILAHHASRNCGWSERLVFSVLFVTFVQPAWLLAVIWVTSFVPGVVSYTFAVLSGTLLCSPAEGRGQLLRVGVSGLLLMAAFWTYPPGACSFFWPFILFGTFDRDGPLSIISGKAIAFFALICVMGLTLDRLFVKDFMCAHWTRCLTWIPEGSRNYSLKLVDQPIEKLQVLWSLIRVTGASWLSLLPLRDEWKLIPVTLILAALIPISASGELSRNPRAWMAHGIFGLGGLILVNLPNLLTTGAVVAFRTTAPITLFLGIGFCKSLLLLRSSMLRRSVDLAFKTSLVGASIFVSISIFGYYHSVWERVVQDPQVRQACRSNQPDLLRRAPTINAQLRSHFTATDSYDLGHPMFVDELVRGTCRVLGN